jgi:hypothetical protein
MTVRQSRPPERVGHEHEDNSEQGSLAVIFPIVAIVVIVLAFVVPGVLVSLRERSREGQRDSAVAAPRWWPQFEREFRAYVRQLERGTRDARRSHTD